MSNLLGTSKLIRWPLAESEIEMKSITNQFSKLEFSKNQYHLLLLLDQVQTAVTSSNERITAYCKGVFL